LVETARQKVFVLFRSNLLNRIRPKGLSSVHTRQLAEGNLGLKGDLGLVDVCEHCSGLLHLHRKEIVLSNPIERLAYSIKSFARAAELSESFVKREIYDGNLKSERRRGRIIIPVEYAKAYLTGESQNSEAQIQGESLLATP